MTAPSEQVIAATGIAITRTVAADGWAALTYVMGPAREFTLNLSPRFQTEEAAAYGARVISCFLPEDAAASRSALYDAVAALEVYSDQFGPYPYREMAVVQAPLTFHGMEFPGLNLIGSQAYNKYLTDLETLVVHEVAHQWWYNQVGSDQTQNPWLDEGLAEFSMYFYFLGRHGQPAADLLRLQRWEAAVAANAQRGLDAPIGRPVLEYKRDAYETIVYGKGALFFATLRDEMGEQAFCKLLRTYVERFRWRTAARPTSGCWRRRSREESWGACSGGGWRRASRVSLLFAGFAIDKRPASDTMKSNKDWQAMSLSHFQEGLDNDDDAVYDSWRAHYQELAIDKRGASDAMKSSRGAGSSSCRTTRERP